MKPARRPDRAEPQDERDERGARRQGIGEQRHRHVAGGEALAHDPRSDHRREQERRARRLGGEAAAQIRSFGAPAHAGRGLRARTNALMNFPSTDDTSMPSPAWRRKSRASSAR